MHKSGTCNQTCASRDSLSETLHSITLHASENSVRFGCYKVLEHGSGGGGGGGQKRGTEKVVKGQGH